MRSLFTRPLLLRLSSPLTLRPRPQFRRRVKVAVWWDFESCSLPIGADSHTMACRLNSTLRSSGINGPLTITAFGDVACLDCTTQRALVSTGIRITHIPRGKKDSSSMIFMAYLLDWFSQNPPPAHMFLISENVAFANILHRARMRNYNVLLANQQTSESSAALSSAATLVWPWNGLFSGKNATAKRFNNPPDTDHQLGSWYGNCMGVLNDSSSQKKKMAPKVRGSGGEQSERPNGMITQVQSDHPVPEQVVDGIIRVLLSHPGGMVLPKLMEELKKNNVSMEKNFFGHKKFSRLLASMTGVVKLAPHPSCNGQHQVMLKENAGDPASIPVMPSA